MKKNLFSQLLLSAVVMATALFISCKPDEPEGPQILLPKLDGMYVYGSNTVAEGPTDPNARMTQAPLDKNQGAAVEMMDGVYGRFMYIGANSTIQFAIVTGGEGVVYGAEGGGSLDSANTVGSLVKDKVIHGTLLQNGPAIEVAEEGLYNVFVNANTESFILMKVKAQMIGDATELQWAAGTPLPMKSTSKDSTVFEGTELVLRAATGYRYRFNDGWHTYADNTVVTLSSLGVLSYGEAWDTGINNLGYFLENIPHKETGYFTVKLVYSASTGAWTETKTKTADYNVYTDYSAQEMGWFGNAYLIDGAEPANQWGEVHLAKTPEKDGNLYHWKWTIDLIKDRAFVLRDPAGTIWITYGGAGKLGAAFDNGDIIKEDGQDNYWIVNEGTYDVTFTINAEDEGRILTIAPEE